MFVHWLIGILSALHISTQTIVISDYSNAYYGFPAAEHWAQRYENGQTDLLLIVKKGRINDTYFLLQSQINSKEYIVTHILPNTPENRTYFSSVFLKTPFGYQFASDIPQLNDTRWNTINAFDILPRKTPELLPLGQTEQKDYIQFLSEYVDLSQMISFEYADSAILNGVIYYRFNIREEWDIPLDNGEFFHNVSGSSYYIDAEKTIILSSQMEFCYPKP